MLDFLIGNDFLSAIIAFAIVLIPTIIIHELGHFFAAKAAGITVIEFGIGFPPRMMRLFMWGETEFTLNWLPLGGFVRPLGEDLIGPVSDEKANRDRQNIESILDEQDAETNNPTYLSEREEMLQRGVSESDLMSVNEAKPLPRIFFMVAGALANFISAIVLFIIVALIGLPEFIGTRFQFIELPPALTDTNIQVGDAVEQINGTYFSNLDEFLALIPDAGESVSLTMRSIETNENYEAVVNLGETDLAGYVMVTAIQEGSPAQEAGLMPDDAIIAVNGSPFENTLDPISELQTYSDELAGKEITLTILRNNESLDLTLIPREETNPNEGRIGIGIRPQYGLGEEIRVIESLQPQQRLVPQPLGAAIQHGFTQTFDTFSLIFSIPGRIIEGTLSAQEARPVSIVGISQIGGQFLQESIEQNQPVMLLNFVALISIFVGATNLLPLPALDGGRVLFVLIEIIRGKPIAPEREGIIHTMGFAFLLSIGVIVIIYDIVNPFVLP